MTRRFAFFGLLAAALVLTGCSDMTAPVAPRVVAPQAPHRDLECRSGYIVAYDEMGDPYCKPE